MLSWYLCRWQIEIYFKVLKSGCRVEELQLEQRERLEPALALYMIIAWRVLYLTKLGRDCPEMPCDAVFAEEEWRAVYLVTQRQPPPEQPPTLDTMVRMLAYPRRLPQPQGRRLPGTEDHLGSGCSAPPILCLRYARSGPPMGVMGNSMVMLSLSFLVKERIQQKQSYPLLSARDIRLLIIAMLLNDPDAVDRRLAQLDIRHQQRRKDIERYYSENDTSSVASELM